MRCNFNIFGWLCRRTESASLFSGPKKSGGAYMDTFPRGVMFYLAMPMILAAMISTTSCSNSEGGKKKEGKNTGGEANANGKDKDKDKVKDDVDDIKDDVDSDNSQGNSGTPDGDSPTNAAICKFVRSFKEASKTKAEVDYLCKNGGLKDLLANPGKLEVIEDKKDGNLSHFGFAGAVKVKGTVKAANKLGETFCADFNEYKQLMGEETFKDVESITPENATKSGCDYKFVGKRQLLFQPTFTGTQKFYTSKDGKLGVNFSYLIEKGSLVENSVSLGITVQDGDDLIGYSVTTSVADTKGLHDLARSSFIQAGETGIKAFEQALIKVSE
jgi:hypothetical protein